MTPPVSKTKQHKESKKLDSAKPRFIEKKFVHKENDENVHLYNLRRIIPRIFTVDEFETVLSGNLSREEVEFLKKYYHKISNSITGGDIYAIQSLPVFIKKSRFEEITEACSEKEKSLINRYYTIDRENASCLNCHIDEIEELRLASAMKMRTYLITDSEKSILSSIFEKVTVPQKLEIYYANMFVDPEHAYFYEHNLDHVPGMMIIETARQLIVSCGHVFGKVPTKGLDFILSKMDIQFNDYLWMSHPVRMKVEMNSIEQSEGGYWKSCAGTISFFQGLDRKAHINIEGMAMNRALLDSIIVKKEIKKASVRSETQDFNHEIYVKDINNDIGYFGTVEDISLKHITAKFRIPILFSRSDTFSFNIHIDRKYYAHGTCGFETQSENDEITIVRFTLSDVDAKNRGGIVKIIKELNLLREHKMAI